jgi:hypothetical protein
MIKDIVKKIESIEDLEEKMLFINELREEIHKVCPFKDNPVDFVKWVKNETVVANKYNPNVVAPPEMKLLTHSIASDGYTQPIVTFPKEGEFEVVDGFHRNRVGKEVKEVREKVLGYLPVVAIKKERQEKNDRIASTIRHNRARGKHQVDSMSEIILELKARNWKNARIAKELGMEEDEILRLCQITGLADLFSDEDFSRSWDIENAELPEDFEPLDERTTFDESEQVRTVNTDDPTRIFHPHEKWECLKAGFYANTFPGKTKDECETEYAEFLSDIDLFKEAMQGVITEWKYSCEHYLTNQAMNRIAWMGQSAMCYATGIPAVFRGGFNLLTEEQQKEADEAALEYLNKWLELNNREPVTMEQANPGRQATIY